MLFHWPIQTPRLAFGFYLYTCAENDEGNYDSVHVLSTQVVYIGVQGQDDLNQFTVVVWDALFEPDNEERIVLEGETGVVFDVSNRLNSAASGITYV